MELSMRYLALKIAVVGILSLVITIDLRAESIFLKDGRIIQGNVLSDESGLVVVKTVKGTLRIKRSEVVRVLYTELNMGKVYIQKRDGTNILAFIVDEDREKYTCRREIFNPEEFTIDRKDVLFVAEKNPSGLQGVAGTTTVKLTWFPPYDPVKKYNIYMKTGKGGTYAKVGESPVKEILLKELKSNSEYFFIVRSVDSTDYESEPSNEVRVVTKNITPLPPDDSTVAEKPGGGYRLSWPAAVDPDGTVKEYRIYKKLDGVSTIIANVSGTEYALSGADDFDLVYMKSVDNNGDESEEMTRFYIGFRPGSYFSVSPVYALPLMNMRKGSLRGYGVTAQYGIQHYFVRGLDLKLKASCLYFPGKDGGFTMTESTVKNFLVVPVLVGCGYSMYPVRSMSVTPSLYAGAAFVRSRYTKLDHVWGGEKNYQNKAFEPVIGAGLSVRWDFGSWFAGLSCDYRYIVEKSGKISYAAAGPFAGFSF